MTVTTLPRAPLDHFDLSGSAVISAHTLHLAHGESPLRPQPNLDGVIDQAAQHAMGTGVAPIAVGG